MLDNVENEIDLTVRHLEIFQAVIENEPIGIVNLSEETGYPHHKVRYSLRVLEEEGLVEPTELGAVPTDRTKDFFATQQQRIDDLIEQVRSYRSELEPSELSIEH